jgi:hypothetical protein
VANVGAQVGPCWPGTRGLAVGPNPKKGGRLRKDRNLATFGLFTRRVDTGEVMPQVIESVPLSFDVQAIAARWFSWKDMESCFWPGRGGRAVSVNPVLAPVRYCGGVYCLAWALTSPTVVGPIAPEVRYIGETSEFRRRMGQFGTSAGFWGERRPGHSGGWRWPAGQSQHTWVSFYPIGNELLPHLATGMRAWMEAVALEEFRLANGHLPEINVAVAEVERFDVETAVVQHDVQL